MHAIAGSSAPFADGLKPCMHTAARNWLVELTVHRAAHLRLLFLPTWLLLFLPFVVRPSANRCQCRYRTRRSACVCSRGAPLHHTSSCCDVGLDSTSPHALQESPPRRSPPSPTACGTHFVCDRVAVLFFFFVVWCLTGPLSASGWVGIKIFFLAARATRYELL